MILAILVAVAIGSCGKNPGTADKYRMAPPRCENGVPVTGDAVFLPTQTSGLRWGSLLVETRSRRVYFFTY